ncbi:MAG: HpcH/HpaI aldolase/citrate lyase family protein [Blastocatellia bacterium]|nr:HpcH/HpaI aldolase/citrate lyase family protein [Blastocatellia bacterium]MCS7158595.1 HpcH/HpaI aldolase/citrate lyase family protein [Blastocatellia bacterium]MDW8169279.1 HpcH/HpaI aldolase/citrate lyase family protein [Acidobacteriota bacterium]MDW8257791.1 HpcH/HpaI aldolase/citrate lyase family protein [Acidobacteriota bacterium]
MFAHRLKERIRNGELVLGSWIALTDPYAVEVMAEAGFDWLVIDMEHCPIGIESLRDILIALKGGTAAPIVRVGDNRPDLFKMALDLGAEGVLVPLVETVQDARRAVEACRYPPLGSRGFGPVRASQYFTRLEEYVRRANEELVLILQIETVAAVRDLEALMAVPGVDAIFIGPGDLASSMGFIGESDHPEVRRAIEEIMARARAVRFPFGILTRTPEEAAWAAAQGATLVTIGGDLGFLLQGAHQTLARTRALLTHHQEEERGEQR